MIRKWKNYIKKQNAEKPFVSTPLQCILNLITDPVWYNFIQFSVCVELIFLFYDITFPGEYDIKLQYNKASNLLIFNGIYLLDVILLIILKCKKFIHRSFNAIWRPWWVITIDIISVIPFDLCFTPKNSDETQIHYLIQLIHGLKLVRIVYYFYKSRTEVISRNYSSRVLEVLLFSIMFEFLVFFYCYAVYCKGVECTTAFKLDLLDITSEKATGKGCQISYYMESAETDQVWDLEVPIIVIMLLFVIFLVYPLTCILVLQLVCKHLRKYEYVYKVYFFKMQSSKELNLDEDSHNRIMNYYKVFWHGSDGFTTQQQFESVAKLNQYILETEMALENCWPLFQHSLLFNDVKLYILRYLSCFITKEVYMPGQNIFETNRLKNSMIYVLSGTVNIVSAENGESGVLSFVEGTCLGESTLIFPYITSTDVRAATPCEVYVLERKHLIKIMRNHPIVYRQLRNKILLRYRIGKSYSEANAEKSNSGELVWIKNTLHTLMSKNEKLKFEHMNKNIYLQKLMATRKSINRHHTDEFLSLLAIKARNSTDQDTVFIKSTFFWILKPNSPIINLWEYIILLVSFATLIIVPYVICFGMNSSLYGLLISIHLLFVIDLLVQIMTPVCSESRAKTVSEIISERFQTLGFIVDLITIIPGELLYLLLPHDTQIFRRKWCQLNKTLKFWRIWRFLSLWENKFDHNVMLQTVTKHFFLYFIVIYYNSCLFNVFGEEDHLFSTLSMQFSTGIGFCHVDKPKPNSILYTFSNNVAFLLEKVAIIGISSALLIHTMKNKNIAGKIYELIHCAKKSKCSDTVLQRLDHFINTQLNENNGLMLIENRKIYYGLPHHMLVTLKCQLHLRILLKVKIFDSIPYRILENLAAYSFVKIYHTSANIIYRGVVYDEVYILMEGKAVILSGLTTNIAEIGSPLNILEMFCKTPSSRSVTALTDVLVLKFNYGLLLELLKEEKVHWTPFIAAIKGSIGAKKELLKTLKGKRYILVPKERKEYSFYTFSGYNVKDSFEEYDYYVPFDRLNLLFFIRYFLLSKTINPNGKFMFYWELCKSICAVLSSFLFIIPLYGTAPITSFRAIPLIFLDIFGYLDIYLRLHVAYYDKKGVIIKHPLSTAKNYFKNGFLIDLIGIIPFNILLRTTDLVLKTLVNMLRYVQLYRVICFTKSIKKGKHRFIFRLFLCILWYYLGINCVASLIFSKVCYITSPTQINCKYLKASQDENFIYIFYFVSNIAATTGVTIHKGPQRDLHSSNLLKYETKVLTFLAVASKIYITSFVFADKTNLFGKEFRLRASLSYLLKWLKHKNISSYLQQKIKNNYDYYWDTFGVCNPPEMYRCLNKSLRRDLLFSFYRDIINHSIFIADQDEINDFYKNILLFVQATTFCKGGYVITINDIESNIFFLFKGKVDVVAADGTCLTELNEGAIFGNLENQSVLRQSVSIVASTNVQVLSLKSNIFHLIIDYFPEIKKSFHRHKIRNLYYVESSLSEFDDNNPDLMRNTKEIKFNKKWVLLEKFYIAFSYIFVLIALYQLGTMDVSLYFNLFFLLWDIITVMYVIVIIFEGKIKKYFSKSQIKNRNWKFLHLIITYPLDLHFLLILIYLKIPLYKYHLILSILRILRLFRITYIIKYEIKTTSAISQASSMSMKLFTVSYKLIFVCLFISVIVIHIDYFYGDPRDNTFLFHAEDRFLMINFPKRTLYQKFCILIKYLFNSLALFICSNNTFYYPNTTLNFCLYIFLFTLFEILYGMFFIDFFELIADGSFLVLRILDLINFLRFYVKDRNLSPLLKQKISRTLSNYWNNNKNMSDFLLIENCPKYLRETIRLRIYGYLFKQHPVFCNIHFDLLRQLMNFYKICVYSANDIIMYKYDHRECIYFIFMGHVAIFKLEVDHIHNAVDIISTGCSFGIFQGIYANSSHKYTYKALTKCEILELELKHWKFLLDFFPASKDFIYEQASNYENATHCDPLIPQK